MDAPGRLMSHRGTFFGLFDFKGLQIRVYQILTDWEQCGARRQVRTVQREDRGFAAAWAGGRFAGGSGRPRVQARTQSLAIRVFLVFPFY